MNGNQPILETFADIDSGAISTGSGMDALVGTILLSGVLTSIVLIVIGFIWNWTANGTLTLSYAIFGENYFGFLRSSITHLFDGSDVEARQFINPGIVTLMLTPFIRVAVSFIYFLNAEKNRGFSVINLIVLSVLTYSLYIR